MKLPRVERGTTLVGKLKLAGLRAVTGERVPDVVRAFMYRPDFFGTPMNAYLQALLRGASEWTIGERELFAAFVSHCNDCEFCHVAHRAVAERTLGAQVVTAVFEDFRTAPVSPQVRAVLEFLDKLTKPAARVTPADARAALAEGVSRTGLEEAIHICAAFTAVNGVADALGFEIPSASALAKSTDFLLKHGYR